MRNGFLTICHGTVRPPLLLVLLHKKPRPPACMSNETSPCITWGSHLDLDAFYFLLLSFLFFYFYFFEVFTRRVKRPIRTEQEAEEEKEEEKEEHEEKDDREKGGKRTSSLFQSDSDRYDGSREGM